MTDYDAHDRDLAARIEAANALRRFTHAFVTHDAAVDDIRAVTEWADAHTEVFANGPRRDRIELMRVSRERAAANGLSSQTVMAGGAGFEDRAVAGKANPAGVDIAVHELGPTSSAIVTFRKANEGPPGRAHGGIVSAVFDDVTGYVIAHHQKPAFTGELTVRLVAPVPLDTALLFRTWLDREEGRKLYILAEALDGDRVVATCKATYITIDPATFTGLAPNSAT